MGILDFFKKFKKETKKDESEKERISFSEIPNFINKKESELKKKEKTALIKIDERINQFSKDIPLKINNLESVDVNSKKAEDRFKSVVLKSRKEYIRFLNSFLESLNNIKNENLTNLELDLDKLFSSFNKSTYKNYERTTILIGKEMTEIKKEIKSLSNDLLKIIQENKQATDFLKKISRLRIDLNKLSKLENNIKILQKEIKNLEQEKLKNNQEYKSILWEIEKIKESKEYKKYLEKKQRINSLKNELTQDINNLKQKIDFKALANFFHIFENKMKIVKEHKENFLKSFEQDNGKNLLDLLEESKLNKESIIQKIQEIKNKKQEIRNLSSNLERDILEKFLIKKQNLSSNLTELDSEKEKKQNKLQEFNNLKESVVNKIKDEIIEFNVEIK
jgi:hypothetical protein